MTSTRIERVQRLLLGLVLASGGAFVWMLLVAETSSWIGERILRRSARETYSIDYRRSGEPVVSRVRYSSPQVVELQEYVTLDGDPVEFSDEERSLSWTQDWKIRPFAEEPIFHEPYEAGGWPRRLIDLPQPLPWSIRLWDCSTDFNRIGHWSFVWPERWSGSAYLAGFDPKTKASRGYIGRNGWQETKPTDAEGFPVGQSAGDGHGLRIARLVVDPPSQDFPFDRIRLIVLSEGDAPDTGMLWLNPQRDELSLINLTKRTTEVVRKFGDAPLRGIAARGMDHSVVRGLLPGSYQAYLQPKLILLWPEHLEFVTPSMQTLSKVSLPSELRDREFHLTELSDGRFLGQWHTRDEIPGGYGELQTHFVWFTATGDVTRRHTFTPPVTPWTTWQQWAFQWQVDVYPPATLMPLGLTSWGLQWLNASALVRSTSNKPFTRPSLWEVLRSSPWTIGLTLLSGLPFAVACWRRQRRVASTTCEQIVWPVLVYFFGLAGWIAFATHRNWPVRRAPMIGHSH